jgi:adenylosuccinate synthase
VFPPLLPPPAPHSPCFFARYASINITKLDVLDDLDEVKIGVAYKINGETLPMGTSKESL